MQSNPYAPPVSAPYQPPHAAGAEPPADVSTFQAIRFGFRGPGFGGLALALLLMIIPIVGPIVLMGWMAETHRRLVRREAPGVRPFSFDEFGNYLKAGVVPFAAQMAVSFVIMVPLWIVMSIMAAIMVPMIAATDGSPIAIIIVAVVMGVLFIGLMTVFTVIMKAIQIRAELTGDFKHTFDIGAAWAMVKRQWLSMLIHTFLLGLIALPLAFLGILALGIGLYFVIVALNFAQVHLRWQIYELDTRTGGPRLDIAPGNHANF